MSTTMDLSMDMDQWSGSRMSYGGSSSKSIYQKGTSRSYSFPSKIKITDVEADKVVKTMMSTIERERKDLDELNAKLATYIVSMRSKEATNVHLLAEIEKMKEAFCQTQSHIREEYAIQIEEAQLKIRELTDGMSPMKAKIASLETLIEAKDKELVLLQKRIEEIQIVLQKKDRIAGELEGECSVLRTLLQEIRQDNKRIRMDNDRIRTEHELSVTKHIKVQNECESLAEEKKYIEITLQAEIRELRSLLSAFEFIQPNLEEAHKVEFRDCIRAIQAEYDCQLAKITSDRMGTIDVQYKQLEAEHTEMRVKYEEECSYFMREKTEMEQRIVQLESELRSVMARFTNVRTDNLNLEISTYRSLLDGKAEMLDELRQKTVVVNGLSSTGQEKQFEILKASSDVQSTVSQVVTSQSSESSRMLTPISIKEVESSGSFILFHNSSKHELDLSNWHIDRAHPKGTVTFKIPNGTKIGPEKEMKIISSKSSEKKGQNDIVANCKTWGSGNGNVKVTDEKGQEVLVFTYTFKE